MPHKNGTVPYSVVQKKINLHIDNFLIEMSNYNKVAFQTV